MGADLRVRTVRVYRYRCCQCKRTFRHYPVGNSVADQTERLRFFAILLWRLGLSHRASSLVLSDLCVFVSHMLIWRDVQEEARKITKRNQCKPVRILGLVRAYVLGWGEKQPVLVAVDLGSGEPIAIGSINEQDPRAVRRWLARFRQRQAGLVQAEQTRLQAEVPKSVGQLKATVVTGYLILDDSVHSKLKGRKMSGLGQHFSNSEQRTVTGHCLFTGLYVLLGQRCPLPM